MIPSRHFNKIEYGDDWARKTTANPGEIYWYQHIPVSIRRYFPEFIEISDNRITMEKINGIVLSHLLTRGLFTNKHLLSLLNVLEEIHNSSEPPDSKIAYKDNYEPKIRQRYEKYDYSRITDWGDYYLGKITDVLYWHSPRIGVIHGDPVFSNIILRNEKDFVFIDMRGRVGNTNTIFGDVFYDYAKIYQSLWGYDFILSELRINRDYLQSLRSKFETYFILKYSKDDLRFLRYITASLLFSLVPLHNEIEKQKKYFNLIQEII
jgi:hypothetical protein